MKKLSILLATLLCGCLFLFGCSSTASTDTEAELDPNELIIGSWQSDSVDTTNDNAANGSDIKSVAVVYTFEFKDDGTYNIESVSTETKTDGTTEDITSDSEGEYTLDGDSLTLEGNDPGKVTAVFENDDTLLLTGEGLGTNDSITLTRADSGGANS